MGCSAIANFHRRAHPAALVPTGRPQPLARYSETAQGILSLSWSPEGNASVFDALQTDYCQFLVPTRQLLGTARHNIIPRKMPLFGERFGNKNPPRKIFAIKGECDLPKGGLLTTFHDEFRQVWRNMHSSSLTAVLRADDLHVTAAVVAWRGGGRRPGL